MPSTALADGPTSTPDTLAPDSEADNETSIAGDGEIVVTARRRSEILLDVPISVTAYLGEQLEQQGALDLSDIADTTPNVTIEPTRGTNSTISAFIRGAGQQDPVAGYEQGVGIYLDDVYLARPQGSLLEIYDVERIEVLRGPQGTLYGRNTIGGAIKYVTRRLSHQPEVRARANLGTYRQADIIVTASAPITHDLRAGGSVARLSRGGFGENLTSGKDNYNRDIWAARGSIEFEPARAFFRLSADYSDDGSNIRGGHRLVPSLCTTVCGLPAYPVLDNEYDSRGGLTDQRHKVRGGGVALYGEVDVTDWLKLKSITAFRKDRTDGPIDFDALPEVDADVPLIYKNEQFSQELQGLVERGPLAGIVGAYHLRASAFHVFDARFYTTAPALLPGLTASSRADVDTRAWAVFGDFTYEFTERLSLSLGARYTSDRRDARVLRQTRLNGGSPELGGSGPFDQTGTVTDTTSDFDGRRRDTAFTPRASISFKPTSEQNIYASYSRGFKGGGFDPRGQSIQAPTQAEDDIYDFMAFDPETVDSYELGWKASLVDRRIQFATAVFLARYKDIQVPGSSGCTILVAGAPTQSFCGITTNAGRATMKGVEFEGTADVARGFAGEGSRLRLSTSVGYIDARYDEFITNIARFDDQGQPAPNLPAGPVDVADFRRIQNTPKWTLSGTVDLSLPVRGGMLKASATAAHRSKTYQLETPSPYQDQPAYSLLDANIVYRFAGDRMTIGLHGKNLTDTRYITSGHQQIIANPVTGDPLLSVVPFLPGGAPNPNYAVPGTAPSLGRVGILTAFYGPPRQVFLSFGFEF